MKIFSYLLLFSFCFPYFALAATTWTERRPANENADLQWRVASDATGQNLMASYRRTSDNYRGRLYISHNYGEDNSWAEAQPNGTGLHDWWTLSSNNDGSVLLAGTESSPNDSRLYVSLDSGSTWDFVMGDVSRRFHASAIDADGSDAIAAALNGRLYTAATANNDVATAENPFVWTERQPAGDVDRSWQGVASDATGTNLYAASATTSTGRLWKSSNSGVDWTEMRPAGDVYKSWLTVGCDTTGKYVVAGVNGGRIYTSDNYGVDGSWTEQKPTGTYEDKIWQVVKYDATAANLFAITDSLTNTYGRVYTSSNNGSTWSELTPTGVSEDKDWYSFAINSDATFFMAGGYNGRLYTGVFSSSVPEFNLTMFIVLLTIGSWFMYNEIVPIVKNNTGVGRLVV